MTGGVLLVGLGAIGMGYDLHAVPARVCTHARAFTRVDAFGQLIGVDPNAECRQAFESTYGQRAYSTLHDALAAHAPSLVVVATPTASHLEVIETILALHQPRAILCEKPLAYDLESANTIVAGCSARGVALYVNYMRRCDPGVRAVRQMLERAEIAAPLKGIVWYSKGLIHNGSHFVDLMRYWLGPVQSARLLSSGRRWDGKDPEPDFILEYSQARLNFLAASEEFFSHYTVELLARNGRLRYERGGERIEWQGLADDPDAPGYCVLQSSATRIPDDMSRYQLNVAEQLLLALAGKSASICTGEEGLQTLRDVYRVVDLIEGKCNR